MLRAAIVVTPGLVNCLRIMMVNDDDMQHDGEEKAKCVTQCVRGESDGPGLFFTKKI